MKQKSKAAREAKDGGREKVDVIIGCIHAQHAGIYTPDVIDLDAFAKMPKEALVELVLDLFAFLGRPKEGRR